MYPPRNPFPAHATVILEGASMDDLTPTTLARPAMNRLADLVGRYRTAYKPGGNDNGRAIAVHGEHGSGKTHALAAAITSLGTAGPVPAWSIYVRADGPDVMSLYRKLLSQVSLPKMQELCTRAREAYARAELEASRGLDSCAVREALETVQAGVDWVESAFSGAELQATAVLDRQGADLAREGLRQREFERVVPTLLNRDLAGLAYRWLTGEQLPGADLRALGITENIDNPLKARMGIQALLILSNRAGQPLAILIDQAEALVTAPDGTLNPDNAGTLRAIVEGVLGNSGLVIVALRESTWQSLPPDLRQRFGPSEIQLTGLTEDEANALVALYVKRWAQDEKVASYPFAREGLREALISSGGNIRRFLQLCSVLFTVAAPDHRIISGDFTKAVLSSEAEPVPTTATIRRQLTDLLTAAHAPFEADYSAGGSRADFAIRNAADGFRAFIVVSDAIVDDAQLELDVAQRTLDLVRRTQRQASPAEIVLVVGGYMSPELTHELDTVHRVLVVTRETSERDLATLVADLTTRAAEPGQAVASLDHVHEAVNQLAVERQRDLRDLVPQINIWNQAVSDQRQSEDAVEAIRAWRPFEEDLRDRIRPARADREKADLDELERLRAQAERDRQRTYLPASAGLLLISITLGVLTATRDVALNIAWLIATGAAAAAICAMLLVLYWQSKVREGSLGKPVRSTAELTLLARGKEQRTSYSLAPSATRNPQVTYAASLARRPYDVSDLDNALARERSAIARRSLVRRLVSDYGIGGFEAVVRTLGGDPATSAGFDPLASAGASLTPPRGFPALESLPADTSPGPIWTPIPKDIAATLTPELRAVARIYGFPVLEPESGLLKDFLEPGLEGRRPARISQLRQAYETENDSLLLATLPSFTEREIRAAAATLSPFDTGKAGAFDWLDKSDEIEELYLFFRKCQFYLGRGIPDGTDQA
jgi:hypothetical protein